MNSEENASPSYSRIPNRVFEWLYGPEHDLTLRQVKILLLAFRCTYGFNRRTAPLSRRFVSRQTGIDERDCSRTLKSLVDAGFLQVSMTRKTILYTILPRRYKNKQDHWVDEFDGGNSPHGGCFTTDDGGDLPPDIERKEKGGIPTSDLAGDQHPLFDEDDEEDCFDPFMHAQAPGPPSCDNATALKEGLSKAMKRPIETRTRREAYLAFIGRTEAEEEAAEALLRQYTADSQNDVPTTTSGTPAKSPPDSLYDQVI